MGGKGRRRREKNYKAAHGSANLLPPPPKASSVDAIPSKLRQLMSLTAGSHRFSKDEVEQGKKKRETKPNPTEEKKPVSDENKDPGGGLEEDEDEFDEEKFNEGQNLDHDVDKKKKKKRKRNQVNDLRFEETAKMLGIGSKRKDRKKKYLEGKKKKKKAKIDDTKELHRHEKIAFGDVVEAPPKLTTVPKAFKSVAAHDASKERLRLKAVDAYRQRKGWVSRPGINLPPPVTSTPLV